MSNPTPGIGKLGNEVDAVAKKKYSLTLPVWLIVGIPVIANLVGVFFHV